MQKERSELSMKLTVDGLPDKRRHDAYQIMGDSSGIVDGPRSPSGFEKMLMEAEHCSAVFAAATS